MKGRRYSAASGGGWMSLNRADEALRVFAALKDTLETDASLCSVGKAVRCASVDPLRSRNGSCEARALLPPPPPQQQQRAAAPSELTPPLLPLPSSSSFLASPSSSAAELRRRLKVADGIMQRLHSKNQQLVQRIATLERKDREGTEERLREELRRRKEEMQQLRDRLQRIEADGRVSGVAAPSPLVELRLNDLERQYQGLLRARVDTVLRKGSVEQVNTRVKELLVQMESKILTDASRHKEELLLLNEKLLDARRKLAEAGLSTGSTRL